MSERIWKIIEKGGAFGLMALAFGWFAWQMVERSDKRTDQMITDQKESNIASLQVITKNTEAIGASTKAIGEVGESVEASKKATEEIARDVRDLREEMRRGE